jgi:translation initiation factor eIF-2B subunit delta
MCERMMKEFNARRRIEQELARIGRDRRSGASELAERVTYLFAGARPARGVGAKAYIRAVAALGRDVERVRPVMAPICNVSRRIVVGLEARAGEFENADAAYAALSDIASATHEQLQRIPKQVTAALDKRFPAIRRPLLISYSSQVITAVTGLRKRRLQVTVCESRPALEGRRTASMLKSVAAVTVITEAQAGLAVRSCDCVILGCEAIHANGAIVNKSGSYLLALAARAASKPVIVLGNSFKLRERALPGTSGRTARSSTIEGERHPAGQVWRTVPRGVRIENVAFEVVPADCVDFIVLETGVYRPTAMRKTVRRLGGSRPGKRR